VFVKEPKGLIFGVTLVKRDSEPKEIFFNLYGIHCDPSEPFQWEKIAGEKATFTVFRYGRPHH